MVHDLVVAVEGRYSFLQHMEGVRIGGDDALEAVPGQRRDVAAGEILEGRLVAEAAGEIAAVAFLLAEHGEVDPGLAQQPDERAQRALVAQVEGAVAEPEQHVGLAASRQDGEREIGRPVEPAGERRPPGLSVASRSSSASAALSGVAPCSSVWKRRRSTMASTCSIIIGHSSTQARQVVQDHSVSGSIMASMPTSGCAWPPRAWPMARPGWGLPA